jgi:hypothetical protein
MAHLLRSRHWDLDPAGCGKVRSHAAMKVVQIAFVGLARTFDPAKYDQSAVMTAAPTSQSTRLRP